MWSVYVNLLITLMLLDNEHGIIDVAVQQWLRERFTMLCYTYVACLVILTHKLHFYTSGSLQVSVVKIKIRHVPTSKLLWKGRIQLHIYVLQKWPLDRVIRHQSNSVRSHMYPWQGRRFTPAILLQFLTPEIITRFKNIRLLTQFYDNVL